jgi:hypothetical protein
MVSVSVCELEGVATLRRVRRRVWPHALLAAASVFTADNPPVVKSEWTRQRL